jgi:carbamoyl-phosphate synthase large subunit
MGYLHGWRRSILLPQSILLKPIIYLTYGADSEDVPASPRKKILVLGSGCYRIGSSVEFDWCAVNTVLEARALGYETILLNCNPETVLTDYDICDRLIFDEITMESILEICATERPEAVVVSMSGQTPNNLAIKLHRAGIKVLGTSPESIDRAESRDKFSTLLDRLGIDQPRWAEARELDDLGRLVESLRGYPVLVRPSYVLSGAAMRVVHSADKLRHYIDGATRLSPEHPVVISKFETDAQEIELDAVARAGEVILWAISEHIERAGVQSGDATLVFPAQDIPAATQLRNEIVPVRYVTFSDPEELTEPLLNFFGTCVKVNSKENQTHSRQTFVHSFPRLSVLPQTAQEV